MANLKQLIDGVGSLQLNVSSNVRSTNFKPNDDFVMRRKINRTGSSTYEVMVGKILAMHDDGTADVNIQKSGGVFHRAVVDINQIEPVTEKFRRSSIQFNSGARPRV